jgi:hypothetical protein
MTLKVTSWIARWGWLLFLPHFGRSCCHLPVRNNRFIPLLFNILLLALVFQNASALELSSDTEIATAGYFQLHWNGANNNAESFLLQESDDPDFNSYKVIYKGKDLARVMSGKPNGEYYYRLTTSENNNSLSSNILKVTVIHHPLIQAVLFFITGAIVFISILILIFKGSRQKR